MAVLLFGNSIVLVTGIVVSLLSFGRIISFDQLSYFGDVQFEHHQAVQVIPDYFNTIKDCIQSAFWGFRYVRAYRNGTYVHSEKSKFSYVQSCLGYKFLH